MALFPSNPHSNPLEQHITVSIEKLKCGITLNLSRIQYLQHMPIAETAFVLLICILIKRNVHLIGMIC